MSTASHISRLPPKVARPLSLGLLVLFSTLFVIGLVQFGGYLQAAIVMARCDAPTRTWQGTVSETRMARGYFWIWLGEDKVFFDDADVSSRKRPSRGDHVEVSALACRRVHLGQDLWQLDSHGQRITQLQTADQLANARQRLWQPFVGIAFFVLVGLWVIVTFLVATARAFSTTDPANPAAPANKM